MSNYKPQEFAEMIGVSVKTLQRWDKEGKLKAYRTPTNRRYYTHKQYVDYMGNGNSKNGKTVIYTRVSSSNQKDDLNNQVEFLKQFANARGIIVDEIFADIGSGLNYNRKKWNKLIEDCMLGLVKTIIVAHKDRFIRFGYDWFERFLKANDDHVFVVEDDIIHFAACLGECGGDNRQATTVFYVSCRSEETLWLMQCLRLHTSG